MKVPPRGSDTDSGSETEVKIPFNLVDSVKLPREPTIITDAIQTEISNENASDLNNESLLENLSISDQTSPIESLQSSKENSPDLSTSPVATEKLPETFEKPTESKIDSLPDAIPNKVSPPDVKQTIKPEDNLPDLITSSPQLSRRSSGNSLSDTNQQYETVSSSMSSDDELKVLPPKLHLKIPPIVTITAPTPPVDVKHEDLDKNLDKPDAADPFEILKLEVRQRRVRNKTVHDELRQMSEASARQQMSKYFVPIKPASISKKEPPKLLQESDVEIVELDIKPKLSEKVGGRDLMKYFSGFSEKSEPEILEIDEDQDDEVESEFRKLEAQIRSDNRFSVQKLERVEKVAQQPKVEELPKPRPPPIKKPPRKYVNRAASFSTATDFVLRNEPFAENLSSAKPASSMENIQKVRVVETEVPRNYVDVVDCPRWPTSGGASVETKTEQKKNGFDKSNSKIDRRSSFKKFKPKDKCVIS